MFYSECFNCHGAIRIKIFNEEVSNFLRRVRTLDAWERNRLGQIPLAIVLYVPICAVSTAPVELYLPPLIFMYDLPKPK